MLGCNQAGLTVRSSSSTRALKRLSSFHLYIRRHTSRKTCSVHNFMLDWPNEKKQYRKPKIIFWRMLLNNQFLPPLPFPDSEGLSHLISKPIVPWIKTDTLFAVTQSIHNSRPKEPKNQLSIFFIFGALRVTVVDVVVDVVVSVCLVLSLSLFFNSADFKKTLIETGNFFSQVRFAAKTQNWRCCLNQANQNF